MTDEPASPVCYAAEGDAAYMGYADAAEIVAALNILLEAERAGTQVAITNRGQAWLVRKIEALCPRLRDDSLHRALTEMAERHRLNIAATDAFIATRDGA